MGFCKGKSILLNDSQKIAKYLSLCQSTPVSYQGIKQSVGYQSILNAQFNFIQFNTSIFPSFASLITRDLKQLEEQEFNSFLQSINNYLQVSQFNKEYDQKVYERIVQLIQQHGNYVQNAVMYFHMKYYFSKEQNKELDKITLNHQSKLAVQIPQTIEEQIWKLFIQLIQLQNSQKVEDDKKLIESETKIMKEFAQYFEAIAVQTQQFSLASKLIILIINAKLKKYLQRCDEKTIQLMLLVYKLCQNDLDQNLSKLNFYELYNYMQTLQENQDVLIQISWDQVINNIFERNLNEITIIEIIGLLEFLVPHKKIDQLSGKPLNSVIKILYQYRYLYQNLNLIDTKYYSKIYQILSVVETDYSEKFLQRLTQKINPKLCTVSDISNILTILTQMNKIDKEILEKFLISVKTKFKDIKAENSFGILFAINSLQLQNPQIFQYINAIKMKDDQEIPLQLQILQYHQLHDPKNQKVQIIQKNLLKSLQTEYNELYLEMFIQILVNANQQTKKTIAIIPELKPYVAKYLQKLNDSNVLVQQEIMQFVISQYNIK
ncbi:unnamed protein product (macronuclear) [Paramecium tetraurelia]|uniref:Uncharacterized protein n=1 Tax=Paramecium tetraurelia TaxID=5888 RepID=A0ECI3_PARTE|nr:uncharacterized protein GSPATT00003869001 [Paramecium tetraurelia]CAK93000.1 unnamed protein product [Paramecium tetraurelia]|eukprot:XP_001460397.1 hypothetical protein (macronuclear) [Paramecium tetraurelia strain d4-2]